MNKNLTSSLRIVSFMLILLMVIMAGCGVEGEGTSPINNPEEEKDNQIKDLFNSNVWLNTFKDEKGELAASVEPQIYEYYMSNGIPFSRITSKLTEDYWLSFENMRNRLNLIGLNNVQNLGEVAHILSLYDEVSIQDKYELIRRYALSVRYSQSSLNEVFQEFNQGVNGALYVNASSEELLVMAGAAYSLLANVDKEKNPLIVQSAIKVSSYYEYISEFGVDADEQGRKKKEEMVVAFNEMIQEVIEQNKSN